MNGPGLGETVVSHVLKPEKGLEYINPRQMAERVGFEPTIPVCARIPLFESGAFSRSATSPQSPGLDETLSLTLFTSLVSMTFPDESRFYFQSGSRPPWAVVRKGIHTSPKASTAMSVLLAVMRIVTKGSVWGSRQVEMPAISA